MPCGPINDIEQAFNSEQAQFRGAAREIPHSVAGVAPTVASPLRLSATPVAYDQAPPMLGQHTSAMLRDVLGMTDVQIEALVQKLGQ